MTEGAAHGASTGAPPRAADEHGARERLVSGPHYELDDQIGFMLRQAAQRHSMLFAQIIGEDLTTTQWAALAKLNELGDSPQNHLGRAVAMDAATVKGVVDRLVRRGLVATRRDPEDGRRLVVALTPAGTELVKRTFAAAHRVTQEVLAPLTPDEVSEFRRLLAKMR
jgi:DNA-binding MarR family transcriptional regulator